MKIIRSVLAAFFCMSMAACAQGPQTSLIPKVVAQTLPIAASHTHTTKDVGDFQFGGGCDLDAANCGFDPNAGCAACSPGTGDPMAGGGGGFGGGSQVATVQPFVGATCDNSTGAL